MLIWRLRPLFDRAPTGICFSIAPGHNLPKPQSRRNNPTWFKSYKKFLDYCGTMSWLHGGKPLRWSHLLTPKWTRTLPKSFLKSVIPDEDKADLHLSTQEQNEWQTGYAVLWEIITVTVRFWTSCRYGFSSLTFGLQPTDDLTILSSDRGIV